MKKFLFIIVFMCWIFTQGTSSSQANNPDITWHSPKPIHLAVLDGDIDVVEKILKDDPSQVEARDGYGNTPIFYAISKGNDNMVELLISKGANLNAKRKDTFLTTPLEYAIYHSSLRPFEDKNKRVRIFKLLVENGADIRTKDSNRNSVLHYVASITNEKGIGIDYVDILVSQGININEKNNQGNTPLHLAIRQNSGIVETLVKCGADVNSSDNEGYTPLHCAASSNYEIIKYLLLKKARINARTKGGRTPLIAALYHGDSPSDYKDLKKTRLKEDMRKRTILLIDSGASVNVKDNTGKTPLHYAVFIKDRVVIKRLLKAGANKKAKDAKGYTPVDYARLQKNKALIELFSLKKFW